MSTKRGGIAGVVLEGTGNALRLRRPDNNQVVHSAAPTDAAEAEELFVLHRGRTKFSRALSRCLGVKFASEA
jgi:hypothetical protein